MDGAYYWNIKMGKGMYVMQKLFDAKNVDFNSLRVKQPRSIVQLAGMQN